MGKIKFLFGIHMHQPVDNLSWAVENAVNKCYAPLFKLLKKYPDFKFALHSSSWLLNEIKEKYQDVFDDILFLNDLGSIEFFTGGFYEPVLCSIPSNDRIKQIERLNKLILNDFNQCPKGLWLTERVWEDSIIPNLSKAGIDYVMVDDYHFIASCFNKEDLDGYYFTENSGKKISLFPINKKLRYSIPFKKVDEAIKDIKSIYKNTDSAAILFDDAEKFGLWPKTYSWVYENGWLENFLDKIIKDENIESIHFSQYFEKHRPKGLTYLQNVSYFEMGEWSLKSEDALMLEKMKSELPDNMKQYEENFIKGGIWKNFFIKYEESNRIHKRMLELSSLNIRSQKFKDSLYKLQTNDVLWHGVFGGLYLSNLRDNAYKYLTECENIRYKKQNIVEVADIDLNGFDEVKVVNENFIIKFDSHFGGQITEFLLRDKLFNLQNTLTRRKEAYHKIIEDYEEVEVDEISTDDSIETIHNAKIEITDEIKNSLDYDWYIKNSFIDHISNDSFTLENFKKSKFWEYSDFANQPFKINVNDNMIEFNRKGGIYFDQTYFAELNKKFFIDKESINFKINLNTESPENYRYALEMNFHFAEYELVSINGKSVEQDNDFKQISSFTLVDKYLSKKITFTLNQKFDLFSFCLKTVSQNEKGFELSAQGLSLAMVFDFNSSLSIQGVLRVENV